MLFNILRVAFQTEVLPQETLGFIHSACIIGDAASLSDERIKHHLDPVSGNQALSVLSQIQGCTYEREDLEGERRLGLLAQQVEEACYQLAIDNVVSSKLHKDGQYKPLDYSRPVSLLIPALNTLAKRVEYLESKVNKGAA